MPSFIWTGTPHRITREGAGAAVNSLQQTLDDQTKKTEQLGQAVATTYGCAGATKTVAALNAVVRAYSNAGLELLVQDLHAAVQTMHENIVNAESRAEEARKVAEEACAQQAKAAHELQQAK